MFLHANTWYGKYRFIPYDPVKKTIDYKKMVDYQVNQKLIKLVKYGCINMHEEILSAINRLKLNKIEKFSEKNMSILYNTYKNKSVLEFCSHFFNNRDETCHIFQMIYLKVMDEIGMVNLHGSNYFKEI